jgi:hypothetical protein
MNAHCLGFPDRGCIVSVFRRATPEHADADQAGLGPGRR